MKPMKTKSFCDTPMLFPGMNSSLAELSAGSIATCTVHGLGCILKSLRLNFQGFRADRIGTPHSDHEAILAS